MSLRDYKKFLSSLMDAVEKYAAILHAFVLMANHYHLIVETPEANLRQDQLLCCYEDLD